MRNFFLIFQKEFRSYFNSPIAFVVITIFLIISGYFFYNIFATFSTISFQAMTNAMLARQYGQLNITEMVVRPFFAKNNLYMLIKFQIHKKRCVFDDIKGETIKAILKIPSV